MTLPNRMHSLIVQDQLDADRDLQGELAAYRAENLDAADMKLLYQNIQSLIGSRQLQQR